ncbi:MAG TPA: PfkB family carbohydrate kinase [Streptosporangiaceae bacterium]|nr:PfkB family carbohydrate kinase [Streptosporangiaceae bacterium]
MIVTVTLNPALHVGYQAERVSRGAANPVSRVSYRAGGRGLAVAKVLHTFGHEVVAAGLLGGSSGELIRDELARAGVATQFTRISGESRRILEITDGADGTVTTFAEPAPYITTEELGRLAADYRALMADATAAVLCGSLPDGLPAETYGSLASYAAEAGVPVVLDASGSALRHAVSRRPALVIPGDRAADPAGGETSGGARGPAADAVPGPGAPAADGAAALVARGAAAVAILSGASVRAVTATGEWRAELAGQHPPRLSREAMVAGFVPGIALAWSWPDTLAHAMALAASSDPAGDVDLEAYERLLPTVTVVP